MKKRFLLIPAIGLPLLTIIPAINSYSNVTSKAIQNKASAIAEADVNNYSVVIPELTHYAVGEKLDLCDLKVTYNDLEKGAIDITNECKLSMQDGQELTQEGELDVTIQHNEFNGSFKIYVENEPTEVPCADNIQKMGDINVEFKLMSNQECIFTDYDSGEGTLEIPDYVERNGIKYFIKQIPSSWSDGENDITGLKFNCRHLKTISGYAFAGTNCLDCYFNSNDLLVFPEGLEEIDEKAFLKTDCAQHSIKGYSFPSTLKKISNHAFWTAPYIDGDGDNGVLEFRSIPEIANDAFYIPGTPVHDCKWIYGSTLDIAETMHNKILGNDNFNCSKDFLIPRLIGDDYCELINDKWGDIDVKCVLTADECILWDYIGGSGTLLIPDYVEHNGKIYYVKEILSSWSDGENDITGLEFNKDVSHLKKICDKAFEGTNCLDEYINNNKQLLLFPEGLKDVVNKYINNNKQLLLFPEGLEEIGEYAFSGTDYGQHKMKGYSFPSTLKRIGENAFSKAPYIDGNDNNGELQFRSIPEIASNAFYVCGAPVHDCKYIKGKTQELAEQMVKLVKDNLSDDFNTDDGYLIPQVIEEKNI